MRIFFGCLLSFMIKFIIMICAAQAQAPANVVPSPNVIPPATKAMQHPEFWISRIDNPDRVILTPKQIKEFNRKNRPRYLEGKDSNGKPFTFKSIGERRRDYFGIHHHPEKPLDITIVNGDSLRLGIKRGRDFIAKALVSDRRLIPFSQEQRQEILENIDIDSIPDTVIPQHGILTANTLCRRVPSHLRAFNVNFSWWIDAFQRRPLETGMPVPVLHMSKNRDWYYVNTEISFGWIPASNVALGTVEEIKELAYPKEFIVAAAHKVPAYADNAFDMWVTDFYQGARLKLVGKTDRGYRVLIPHRGGDGSLVAVPGWVKPDAEVSVGFLPFTQRNMINTVFKLLNRPYRGGGGEHERDCDGTVRTVLKVFGIFASSITTHQLYYTDHVNVFPEGTPKEIKYKILDTCEPGITLCGFPNHIVIYLGKADGNYFVIHSNGYSYHESDGTELRVARVSVTDTELEGGGNIERFTEISTIKP
ncbi:SH3 domain-containing protein [Candidatus Omnitrophota bacterium]